MEELFGLTTPFSVAVLSVIFVAEEVVTVGANIMAIEVEKVLSEPQLTPSLFDP